MPIRNGERTVELTTVNERGIAGRAEFGDPLRTGDWHPHVVIGWLGDRENELGVLRVAFSDIGAVSLSIPTENGLTITGANATAAMFLRSTDVIAFDLTLTLAQLARYRVGSEIRLPYDVTGGRGLKWNYQTPLTSSRSLGLGMIEGVDGAIGTVQRNDWADGSYTIHSSTTRMDRVAGNGFAERLAGTGKIAHIRRPLVIDQDTGQFSWGNLEFDGSQLTLVFDATWFAGRTGPFLIDPDIGYTSIGASSVNVGSGNQEVCGWFVMPEDGDLNSITGYAASGGIADWTMGVFDDDGGSQPSTVLRDTAGGSVTSAAWFTQNLDSDLSVSNAALFWLGVQGDGDNIAYDGSGGGEEGERFNQSLSYASGTMKNYTAPTEPFNLNMSIYTTYTATGGGGATIPVMDHHYRRMRAC